MSYWIYKECGRVVGMKEINASINKWAAPWYLRPYYSFVEWNEKRKRYNSADIKLKSDNPYSGCSFVLIGCFAVLCLLCIVILFLIEINVIKYI